MTPDQRSSRPGRLGHDIIGIVLLHLGVAIGIPFTVLMGIFSSKITLEIMGCSTIFSENFSRILVNALTSPSAWRYPLT